MPTLAQKTCTPCKGGVDPLSRAEAAELLHSTPNWELINEGKALKRRFEFKNFAQSLDLVNKIGKIAEKENHHPDIYFGWGYCEVTILTHKINGLHENDFILAAKINGIVS